MMAVHELCLGGVCWSIDKTPTLRDNKRSRGNGLGSFTVTIARLEPGTTYYVRAYATNSKGVAYGNREIFTTNNIPVDPYKFIFYKDRYSDTTIYSSYLNSYGTTQHSYTIITNKLSLPPGIFLYVTVDTIIGKIYAGIFGDPSQRKMAQATQCTFKIMELNILLALFRIMIHLVSNITHPANTISR